MRAQQIHVDIINFKEFFTYNHTVRQDCMKNFSEILFWNRMIKNHETGWRALKDTLSYTIWAEESWINIQFKAQKILRPFHFYNFN